MTFKDILSRIFSSNKVKFRPSDKKFKYSKSSGGTLFVLKVREIIFYQMTALGTSIGFPELVSYKESSKSAEFIVNVSSTRIFYRH